MFRKTLLLAGILGFSFLNQSCSLFEKDVYVVAEVPEIENSFEPTVIWHTSVGDGVEEFFNSLSPAVTEERVFVAARDGDVKALDRRNGSTVWKIDLSDEEENDDRRSARISAGVSVGFDKVFVASENGYVYAIDRSDGTLVWKHYVGSEVLSAPSALIDKVLVYTASGRLIALSDSDGSEVWKTPSEQSEISLRGSSNLSIVDGDKIAIYGTSHGKINIINTENGMLLNSIIVSLPRGTSAIDRIADVDSQPVFSSSGAIFAVGYHGQLVSLQNGYRKSSSWKKGISSYSNLAFDYSDVFVTDDKGHVHALSQSTGDERWENHDLSYRGVTAPAILNGYVLVGDMDGYLYWLESSTGKIVSMDRMDSDGLYIPPVIYDGIAYLQTRNGEIFALTLGPASEYEDTSDDDTSSSYDSDSSSSDDTDTTNSYDTDISSSDDTDTTSSYDTDSSYESNSDTSTTEDQSKETKSWSKWFKR